MKIESYPFVSLYEIAAIVAQHHMLRGFDTHRVYQDMLAEITDTDEIIIRYSIPDEQHWNDYTIEFQIMFNIVMEHCGLSSGDCFLIDLTA